MFWSPRKVFWERTVAKIIIGVFLLVPLAAYLLASLRIIDPNLVGGFFSILILPWIPFVFSSGDEYLFIPYLLVTAFFLAHVIFARSRFPHWSAFLRKARPFVFLLILAYLFTGWSHFFNHGREAHVGRFFDIEGTESHPVPVDTSGFPFRFSINALWIFEDETDGLYLFKSEWFLASFAFYLALFAVLWFVLLRLMRYRRLRQQHRDSLPTV